MFIYLDESLLQCINTDQISHDVLHSLEGLSFMLRKGVHQVSGERNTLRAISDLQELSAPARSLYKKLIARCTQVNALLSHVKVYARIVCGPNEIERTTESDVLIIKIPIEKVLQLNFQSPTSVVFEDISDDEIYSCVWQWYVSSVMSASSLPINYHVVHGGGNRTHLAYEAERNLEDKFVLCITDSDKKYPNDSCGQTSEMVRAVDFICKPLSFHLDLDFHEIENLLPLDFLDSRATTDEAREIIELLRNGERSGHPESKLYWDYKKGVKGHFAREVNNFQVYWSGALGVGFTQCNTPCTSKNCTCFAIRPWPLKREVKEAIENRSPMDPAGCNTLKDLWHEIGSRFVSWTIGSIPQGT